MEMLLTDQSTGCNISVLDILRIRIRLGGKLPYCKAIAC